MGFSFQRFPITWFVCHSCHDAIWWYHAVQLEDSREGIGNCGGWNSAGAIWGQIENWPLHTNLTHPSLCTVLSHIAMNVSDPHFWMIEIVRHWIRFNAEEAKRVDLTNGLHPSGCILPILLLLLLQLSLLLPLLLLLLSKLWILILLLSPAAAADPFPVAHDSSCRRCGLLDAF